MIVSFMLARIVCFSIAIETGRATFDVVSSGAKVDFYFYLLTLERSGEARYETPKVGLQVDARWDVCRDAFANDHFKRLGEEPIADVDEAYKRLKSEHKSVFDTLRKESKNSNGKDLERVTDLRLIDNIDVGAEHVRTSNYVWTCLTRHRTKSTKVYFVSDQFNVAINAATSKSAGHFILRPEEGNEKTTVYALAEEAAYEIFRGSKLVEMRYYIWYRKSTTLLASTADSDALCRLAKFHKIRVCAKVLKSPFLRNKIAFVQDERLFKEQCVKREVSFRSRSIRNEVRTKGIHLEEWMLWCPTRTLRTTYLQPRRVDYFVSRAEKSNEAFLYSRTSVKGRIFLEGLLEGVSPISVGDGGAVDQRVLDLNVVTK